MINNRFNDHSICNTMTIRRDVFMNTDQSVSGNQHTYNIVPQIPAGSRPGQACFCVFPTGLSSLDYLNFGLPLWIISSLVSFFFCHFTIYKFKLFVPTETISRHKTTLKERNIESSINYWNILVVCAFKLFTSVSAAVRLEIRNKSIVPAEGHRLPPGRLLLSTVTRTT